MRESIRRRGSWLALVALSCAPGAVRTASAPPSGTPLPAALEVSELSAPRPIAPLTGFAVSSHRPTFRVAPARGSDGTQIEVCRDRDCTAPVARFAGTGDRIRANVVLPEARLFYRARALRRGKPEGPSSVAFQFAVRRGAPGVDTAAVAFNDANADGRDDDVTFGAALSSAFRVAGMPAEAAYYRVGDVNGDGFSDVIAAEPCAALADCTPARFQLFRGGKDDFSEPSAIRLGNDRADRDAEPEFVDAGDVNGDGYADVVEFYPSGTYLRHGCKDGLEATAVKLTEEPSTAGVLGGDFDGDGFSDIVVAQSRAAPPHVARVHLGGPNGPDSSRVLVLRAPDDAAGFGSSVVARGDVNADGYSDVVIGAASAPDAPGRSSDAPGQIYVFYGGPKPRTEVAAVLRGTDVGGAYFGLGLGVGDLDGNGAADVVGVAPCVQRSKTGECRQGQALVFPGSAKGIATVPVSTLGDPSVPSTQIVLIRDVEGDGFDDLSYAGGFYPGSPRGVDRARAQGVP